MSKNGNGRLTDKQKKFINAYILCLNATESARRAGYAGTDSVLAVTGHKLLRNAKIRDEIDRIFKASTMQASEVLQRLSAQARGDIADVIDPITNIVDWNKARDLGVTHLIHKTKQRTIIQSSSDGDESETHTLEVQLYNAQEALKVLAKYHALFTTRLEIVDWRSKAIDDIRNGIIPYDVLADRFDTDLATELFKLAGVPVESQ